MQKRVSHHRPYQKRVIPFSAKKVPVDFSTPARHRGRLAYDLALARVGMAALPSLNNFRRAVQGRALGGEEGTFLHRFVLFG